MRMSPSGLYEKNPALYLLFLGIISTKITVKLIICHMSRSEMAYFDSSMTGMILLFLNQYFYCIIDESIILWLAFIYSIYDLMRYATLLCQDISNYLNIYTFSIAKREAHHGHHRNSSSSGNALMFASNKGGNTRASQATSTNRPNAGERKLSRRGQWLKVTQKLTYSRSFCYAILSSRD